MEVKRDILWRVYLGYIAVVVVCVVILGKAFYIQQVQGKQWRNLSDSLHQHIEETAAERGTIYSEDGQMLSTSIPQFDVYIDFGAEGLRDKSGVRFRDNVDSLSYCLADLFKDRTTEEYKKLLQSGYKHKNRYFLLKRKISFREYQQMKQFPLVRLGRNKSGFIAEVRSMRLNPYQMLAFRTIGLDRDSSKVGLELTYDSVLSGIKGKRLVRYIGGGVSVPVDEDYQLESENGKDVITTLDVHIQDIAESSLLKMLQNNQAEQGCAIVMEVGTGKIKAIANLGKNDDDTTYSENLNYALRNTEPGSTIKLATLLSVLSEGGTSLSDKVEVGTTGSAYVGVRMVTDHEPAPKPVLTVEECFAHSSNVGMGKIAYKTFASKPGKFLSYLHQLRLDSVTGIDLVGETKPKLPKMKKSNEGLHEMVTMSFGYAIQMSPLQTLTLYNAIANGGKMVKPYLVNSIDNDGVPVKEFSPVVLSESICKPNVVKAAQECMRAVVTEGTAKGIFALSPYTVAGKTGTAHVADGKYKYDDGVYQASFVGYFPAEKPQYSCIVVIRTRPHAFNHFGGGLSGPVFRDIADRLYTLYVKQKTSVKMAKVEKTDSSYYSYTGMKDEMKRMLGTLNVPYSDNTTESGDWAKMYRQADKPVVAALPVNNKQMPALGGMGLKDAIYVCESMGLKVKISGKGKVMAQSITAGQAINKGQQVTIQLN
ncbi:cell division protein FtsI (penicillin-binding protein 3) [Filimonas lacunae]|uniref:Cell division protein FtsI (Penicillin-binding protein 3) n=1 Tax=Filimonas lacunae TaxID=477680 RepID=A0A173MSB0_9BACT|nr:penicillin-binding protein [Filimonas lacunae]BAV10349.1 cell division protein FtsI [Filimonas lacunae]SIT16807.1 cell division protein FtsI (penicillin-binding protein 3) [Filimonas lacunae]